MKRLFPRTSRRLTKLSRYKREYKKIQHTLKMFSNVQMDRHKLICNSLLLADAYNGLKYFWQSEI